jgi:membrane-bound lytic murein transglycosylase B
MVRRPLAALVLSLLFATSAPAAPCGGDFNTFIAAMAREAQAAGVSRANESAFGFLGVAQPAGLCGLHHSSGGAGGH